VLELTYELGGAGGSTPNPDNSNRAVTIPSSRTVSELLTEDVAIFTALLYLSPEEGRFRWNGTKRLGRRKLE